MTPRTQHPASHRPFAFLRKELDARVDKGYISTIKSADGLCMYNYTKKCVDEDAWDEFTLIATGLILDTIGGSIVAHTIPKMFEISDEEKTDVQAALIEVTEKIDGDMVLLFWDGHTWRIATKDGFEGATYNWAKAFLRVYNFDSLTKGDTYILEAVCGGSRGIIPYATNKMHMITSYNMYGFENFINVTKQAAYKLGIETPARYYQHTVRELCTLAQALPLTQEGFVVRFNSGTRVRITGHAYQKAVDSIAEITPLNVWGAMLADLSLSELLGNIPVPYTVDFHLMVHCVKQRLLHLIDEIVDSYSNVKDMTDRELGKSLKELPESVRNFMFPYRLYKGNLLENERVRIKLFDQVRPDANILKGYKPSRQLRKVQLRAA